jgi:hypothetical protein
MRFSRSKFLVLGFLVISLTQLTCRRQTHAISRELIVTDAPLIALTHVRVIDGTGAPAKEDQTILIEAGAIKAIGKAADVPTPATARTLDLKDQTAIPGLVGMHEHLFYSTANGTKDVSAATTFPRLYLASGVTTIRTTGTLNLDDDIVARDLIDSGQEPGPKIYLTSPYINRAVGPPLEASEIEAVVSDWAGEGVTSFKVYTNIGRAELASVIAAAHKRGLKVTGHLCAVGYRDAVELGIDNLEHGLLVDTEFYSDKKPDECPNRNAWLPELARLDVHDAAVQALISDLVSHHVAITSTLPIFETFVGEKFHLDSRMQQVLSPEAYQACLSHVAGDKADSRWPLIWQAALRNEMEFEHEFVQAGGFVAGGSGPDWMGRSNCGVWRSAWPRTPGGGRLHPRRGHPHCHRQRCRVPRRAGSHRHTRGGQTS